MAKNIIITLEADSTAVKVNTDILGVKGENLQGEFIVDFVGDGFVSGACWLELKCGKDKGYIELSQDGNTYKAPIKSGVTKHYGKIEAQIRITGAETDTPIFKSDTFILRVLESIDALDEIADEYPEWIDLANAKLAEVDKAIAELQLGIKVDETLSILPDGRLSVNTVVVNAPLQIQIDDKVPKALSIFPQATSEQIDTDEKREAGKIYIDVNGTPSNISLQQIKDLNTKIIRVDEIADGKIFTLSNGDFILLKKE